MSPLIWAVLAGTLLAAVIATLNRRSAPLKRGYYFGIHAWGQWLPVVATGLYLALLVVNLAALGELADHSLSLSPTLSLFEMIFMLMVGPLFLTRWGNVVAAGVLVYFGQKVLLGSADSFARGASAAHLMLAAVTAVAVLGDKMPWLTADTLQTTAQKLREILLLFVAIGALGIVATGVIKYGAFNRWFNVSFGAALPAPAMLGLLTAVFIGWLSIALGLTRHFMMPLVTLPTLLVLAYLTSWPAQLMVVPFTACLALALATADRRLASRRRQSVYRTGYLPSR